MTSKVQNSCQVQGKLSSLRAVLVAELMTVGYGLIAVSIGKQGQLLKELLFMKCK